MAPSTRPISGKLGTPLSGVRLVARRKDGEMGYLQGLTGDTTHASSKDCHLVLEDGTVSRKLAEQSARAGGRQVKDRESRHRPHLAGSRLKAAFVPAGATPMLREVETPPNEKVTAREAGIKRVSQREPLNKHGIDVSAL